MRDIIICGWLLITNILMVYYGLFCFFAPYRAIASFSGSSNHYQFEISAIAITEHLGLVYLFWTLTGLSLLSSLNNLYLIPPGMIVTILLVYYARICYFAPYKALTLFLGNYQYQLELKAIAITKRLGSVYLFWSLTQLILIWNNQYSNQVLLIINMTYSLLLSNFIRTQEFYARKAINQNLGVALVNFLLLGLYFF